MRMVVKFKSSVIGDGIILEDFHTLVADDEIKQLRVGDFNNDGYTDIACFVGTSNSIPYIFINDGTGQFSYIETSGLDKLYNYMVVEDLDNDGDTDLVLCGYNNSIRIFENTGDANFRLKST